MENEKFQFTTNINCGGCVSAVTPFLDGVEGIKEWHVDTDNKEKILTVQSVGISPKEIEEAVKKAGYKIEAIA